MFETDPRRKLRVGLFMALMIVFVAIAIVMIGGKQGLFVKKVPYFAKFTDVGGLTEGAPVWLNGVVVGQVTEVRLPSDPGARQILVAFNVDARVARRIRGNSKVRIRTLGLLGDRYLEVSSGSPEAERLAEGAEVPSEEQRDVSEMLSQGGDVVTNVRAISTSLRRILERVERGEGVLGELTTNPESGRRAVATLNSVLDQADALLKDVRAGRGALGRLVSDPEVEKQLVDDIVGFAHSGRRVADSLARDLARDDSVIAELLRDPQGRARLQNTLDRLGEAATAAAETSRQLSEGKGTLGRLINDKQFADSFLTELNGLTASLHRVADKLDRGEGTAGKMVNDPQLWQDLEDVVRGVKESKMLGWLIRNRRNAGEEARQEEAAAKGR